MSKAMKRKISPDGVSLEKGLCRPKKLKPFCCYFPLLTGDEAPCLMSPVPRCALNKIVCKPCWCLVCLYQICGFLVSVAMMGAGYMERRFITLVVVLVLAPW